MTGTFRDRSDMPRPAFAAAPERALMHAVLDDAIGCLAGDVGQRRERGTLAAEARQWIDDPDRRWPYSFENVCDALGLDADYMRARLRRTPVASLPHATASTAPSGHAVGQRKPEQHEVVQEMIRSGTPLRAVAERFGISISKVSVLSCGLASRLKAERDGQILELRRAGWTYRALGARFGLSRIRVMRICTRAERAGVVRRTAA